MLALFWFNVSSLCPHSDRGITSMASRCLWFVQTFLFGYASLGLLFNYDPRRSKQHWCQLEKPTESHCIIWNAEDPSLPSVSSLSSSSSSTIDMWGVHWRRMPEPLLLYCFYSKVLKWSQHYMLSNWNNTTSCLLWTFHWLFFMNKSQELWICLL